jgi:hypothetical protein
MNSFFRKFEMIYSYLWLRTQIGAMNVLPGSRAFFLSEWVRSRIMTLKFKA